MIEPTVGRQVWYSGDGQMNQAGDQPCAATVVYVHDSRSVNLLVLDHVGTRHQRQKVVLLQDDDKTPAGPHAKWMPYQVGQAAKLAEKGKK